MPEFSDEQLAGLMGDLEDGLRDDLEGMIEQECHLPLALTLNVLTETLGGLIRGTFRRGEGRANWEEGVTRLGATYEEALDRATYPLYGTLRSALVHTYIFSKTVNGNLHRLHIHTEASAGIERYWPKGLEVDDQAIEVHTNTFAADLMDAYSAQFDEVRRGDPEARRNLENAILSQRIEREAS